ncbi:MAG: galactose mutarotase [Pseudonocardiales bacterium]|nr:galactose mutarotase [Pseudonocardiales bacterium]
MTADQLLDPSPEANAADPLPVMIDLSGSVLQVGVVALGARLALLRAPDRRGTYGDVVLGLDAAAYREDHTYLGATVGRYANRIAGGTFSLDGRRYHVPCNEEGAALHGGPGGFDRQVFAAEPVVVDADGSRSVTLRRTSPVGENGFPGTLEVAVTYRVRGAEVHIDHTATTDAPTVVNLTNHAYFNLTGHGGTVEDHRLQIPAGHYLPVDGRLIPTGAPAAVEGTPFDLRSPLPLGRHLRSAHPQLTLARGYDHTLVLERAAGGLAIAAHVEEPESGRTLTVLTDQPGVQLYSGNFLDGTTVLRDGTVARQGDAFCLEPQHFPNSPNEPRFPTTVLRPRQRYRSRIVFRLGQTNPAGPGTG